MHQGVFFRFEIGKYNELRTHLMESRRAFSQSKAKALNVSGWVKNTPDEKVVGEASVQSPTVDSFVKSGRPFQQELMADDECSQGSESAIASYLKALNDGPRSAHVVKVEKAVLEIKDGEDSFEVR